MQLEINCGNNCLINKSKHKCVFNPSVCVECVFVGVPNGS